MRSGLDSDAGRGVPESPDEAAGNAFTPAHRYSARVLFLLVAGPLLVVYLATASYSRPYHIDAFTNVLTAWEMAQDGDPHLDAHEQLASPQYFGNVGWVVPASSGAVSQYPPGAALHAVPMYVAWPGEAELSTVTGANRPAPPVEILVPPLAPAAISTALVVALASGIVALSLRNLVTDWLAIAGAYVLGLGTSAWAVAANQLWQHGPGMLWIAIGGLLAHTHLWASGAAYGVAILVRPSTALVAAATGLVRAWKSRSIQPALKIGFTSALGLAAVMIFNAFLFGSASVTGGYGETFTENALDPDVMAYLRNLGRALFDPTRGLLIWAPFLIPLLFGLRSAWKQAPAWVKGPALGGLLYLLLQLKANRFSGGAGFSTYRYPLEALVASAPLLMLSYRDWVRHRWLMHRIFILGVAFAISTQATFAVMT